MSDFYTFEMETIRGDIFPFKNFKDKPVLIVNTASLCGFTKQYDDLQTLHNTYKDRGLVVVGIPSNDFGKQEPGSKEDIQEFCQTNFNISFLLMDKYSVTGKIAHPFYIWAAEQRVGGFLFSKPRWNFYKYLISSDGQVVESFGSQVSPTATKVIQAIEREISKIQ